MNFNARGGISILELVVYFPSLLLAVFLCVKHGFGRSSGWVFILFLCLIRIIGACCQLATYSNASVGLFEAVVILDSVGVSPLLLATVGVISRCCDSIREASSFPVNALQFRLLQLLITVGLILGIVGGTNSTSSNGTYTPQTTSKAAVILYIVAWFLICAISLLALTKISHAASGEKRLLFAVLLAIPFLAVRLAYSALTTFHSDSTFNLVNGSVAAYAIMAVVMEFIIIFIYLGIGFVTPKVAAPAVGQPTAPVSSHPPKAGMGYAPQTSDSGRRGGWPRRGLIGSLIGLAVDGASSRRNHQNMELESQGPPQYSTAEQR